MDYRAMFDSEYVGAWDLPPGKDVVVTIASVSKGEVTGQGGRKARKPIVKFVGREKGLLANKTNARAIAGMYGNDTAAWVGKRVALYATRTMMGSEEVDCVRVRPTIPKGQKIANGKAEAAEKRDFQPTDKEIAALEDETDAEVSQ